jgi:erythritol transport system ATP-binding protein
MTGRAAEEPHGHDQPPGGREVLRVDRLSVAEGRGRQWLRGVSFGVRAGEILGIYGLLGAGVTALLEAMAGVRPPSDGSIRFEGVSIDRLGPAERIELGIASVPEDRQVSGLVPTASVRANLCLSALGPLVRMGWISDIAERAAASGSVRALGIRASSLDQNVLSLSGGNQQKVVIGRALMTSPKVLLLDEPTRGVDIGAKAEIQALVRRLAAEGMAVVLGSSDLHDIRTTADRVLVLSRGLVTAEFSREKATDEALALAAGAAWAQEHAS